MGLFLVGPDAGIDRASVFDVVHIHDPEDREQVPEQH